MSHETVARIKRFSVRDRAQTLWRDGPEDPRPLEEDFPNHKGEIYALSAVVIDKVITDALDQRDLFPPFGLDQKDRETPVKQLDEAHPFRDLNAHMYDTLSRVLTDIIINSRTKDSPQALKMSPVLWRLNSLLIVRPESNYGGNNYVFIQGGLGTATHAMSSLLEVIPKLAKVSGEEKPDSGQLIKVAANSYPIITRLSSMYLDYFTAFKEKVSPHGEEGDPFRPFSPDFFTLSHNSKGARVEFSPIALEELSRLEDLGSNGKNPRNFRVNPQLGCPAQIRFGQEPAIRRLWQWHLEIANEIYTPTSQ